MARRVERQGLQDRLNRSFRRVPAEDVPRVFRLGLAEIEPSPGQPRKHIDQDGLIELAASIERHGLIQPITVRRREDAAEGYVLVAGERRFRAHELLGREEILAIVTKGAADEIALIENIQRQDLHPLEEAEAFARMMQAHGWTQEQLAEAVGKARPTVTNILKLNGLAASIRDECLQRGDVSKSLLFEVARQDDAGAQERLWARLRAGGTVRRARAAGADRSGHQQETRSSEAAMQTLARDGRRFLRQLVAAEEETGRLEDGLRKDLAALREDLAALLRRLARRSG